MTGTARRFAILDAFRQAPDGFLTPAELAVPDVGGSTWRWELGEMRKLGYDLHEDLARGGWYLVGDPKLKEAPAPAAFDFTAALRAMTAKGRELNETRGRPVEGDPRIAYAGQVNGHQMAPGVGAASCVFCGELWTDALATRACAPARRSAA